MNARASSPSAPPDHRSSPAEASTWAAARGRGIGHHQPELGDGQKLAGGESGSVRALLADAAVGDQLDDVAGGIVEVAGVGVPSLEAERGGRLAPPAQS